MLNTLGLEQVPGVECLFTNKHIIVFFFVDNIVVLYDKCYINEVDAFQAQLFLTYEMRNIGEVKWFLGIWITRDRQL